MKYLWVFFLFGVLSKAQAITIQTGIGFNPGVKTMRWSEVITTSYQFAIGVFSEEPKNTDSFFTVLNNFIEFTRVTVAANSEGGKIAGPGAGGISAVSTAATRHLFDNKEAYIIVSDGVTLENAVAFGVLKGSGMSGPWRFPADTTSAASMNAIVASADAVQALIGYLQNNADGPDILNYNIPEVSVAALLGMASLGCRLYRVRISPW